MEDLAKLLEILIQHFNKELPLKNSIVPLLIITKVIKHESNGSDLTLKALFSEINSSFLCTRMHLSELETNGWLILESSAYDKRVKFVKSSYQLRNSFQSVYEKNLPNQNHSSSHFS